MRETTTVTILGCGRLGTSILIGLLRSLNISRNNDAGKESKDLQLDLIATVQSAGSATRLSSELSRAGLASDQVAIIHGNNVEAVRKAAVVFLTCPPRALREVLGVNGMAQALADKPLISMLGGTSVPQIEDVLHFANNMSGVEKPKLQVIRSICNVAASVNQSATIVSEYSDGISQVSLHLAEQIMRRFGDVEFVQPQDIGVSTVVAGCGTAFFALFLEAVAEGAAKVGMPADQAVRLAAMTMSGTAHLVLNGESPVDVRNQVCTPGGSTVRGLHVMEEDGIREMMARVLQASTNHKHHDLNGTKNGS